MFHSLGARAFSVPAPVFLIGTYDISGKPNIMTAAWGGVAASQPPSIAVSIQRSRATYAGILRRQAFTVNIPSADMAAQADFAGLASGRRVDKFGALGLTPRPAEHVDAPIVEECNAVIELKLTHTLELGSHVQFIGEVMDVKLKPHCLDAQGLPRLDALNPLLFVPLSREYWTVGEMTAKAFSVGRSIALPAAGLI
ncbi:MAG: flavin reductase family protein [Desulfovibrionaceae bacterium]|nr:flavin reductase family protein [Desulfovibrionaceae bacterium]